MSHVAEIVGQVTNALWEYCTELYIPRGESHRGHECNNIFLQNQLLYTAASNVLSTL